MSNIRWGIIGCGDVTEVKSGPGFGKAQRSELVAVMRRNGEKAADYARRHGVPRWYDNADVLINDSQVDAVYIATPPGSHLELSERVAAAGKPCYVEKPMARSFAECQRMQQAFERAGQKLFVAYYRRALPRFIKLKELLDAGAIGTITGCRYRLSRKLAASTDWRVNVEQSGGGLFLDVGSHVLDLLDLLLGEFVEYGGAATAIADGPEQAVSVHFRTAGNVAGCASWNFAAAADDELLEIDGTAGRIATTVLSHGPLRVVNGDASQMFEIADPPHVAQPLIQTVVNDLLGIGQCPSTGASAARASRVMDAALDSFYAGRSDAFWTRPKTWRQV
jgi:predicted dehydrogenase